MDLRRGPSREDCENGEETWARPHHPRYTLPPCPPDFLLNESSQADISKALIPITAFALGTWQVQRLDWKTKLIAKLEDQLVKPPLPLPPRIDPSVVSEFDYRRIVTTGYLRHDQEMLVGPRMRDGEEGYMVFTPLERGEGQSTVLVNRGWISRKFADQKDRNPEGVPREKVVVEGLLREPAKKNMFTPDNKPEEGRFYFPDIKQMADLTGAQPVLIEETMGIHSPL